MPYEILKQHILSYVAFSDQELELIVSKFRLNSYEAKGFILSEHKVSSDVHFIVNGLVRTYYVRDGKEITTYLASDKGFVSSYPSFINQTKSIEHIQCLEATSTLSISYEEMQELYRLIPQWEKVGRILAEQTLLCLADRLFKLQAIPAKEKYLEFLKTSSDKIVRRTPLLHIASFLGIAPESLSRIRKTIS